MRGCLGRPLACSEGEIFGYRLQPQTMRCFREGCGLIARYRLITASVFGGIKRRICTRNGVVNAATRTEFRDPDGDGEFQVIKISPNMRASIASLTRSNLMTALFKAVCDRVSGNSSALLSWKGSEISEVCRKV